MRSESKEQARRDIESEIAQKLQDGVVLSRTDLIQMFEERGLSEGSVGLVFDQAFEGSAFQQQTGVALEKLEVRMPGKNREKRVFLKDKGRNLQDTNFLDRYEELGE